jgi:uncharacterized protein with von Willebrand factor type A (vWA) domain
MDGGTNIHNALAVADKDILTKKDIVEDVELVVITDGTEYIHDEELKERIKAKKHCILLEDPRDKEVMDSYERGFDTVLVAEASSIEEATAEGLKFVKQMGHR